MTDNGSLFFGRPESPLLNHPKHIPHVLKQYPRDIGDGVDVVFGVVGEAGAGHEIEVLEDGVEAFGGEVVKFAEGGLVVDEEDGVAGGDLGHGDEAAGWKWIDHRKSLAQVMNLPPVAAKQIGWQLYVGSQTEELRLGRPEGLPRTAAIKQNTGENAASYFDGCELSTLGLRNPYRQPMPATRRI
jgi:hypothetical protein